MPNRVIPAYAHSLLLFRPRVIARSLSPAAPPRLHPFYPVRLSKTPSQTVRVRPSVRRPLAERRARFFLTVKGLLTKEAKKNSPVELRARIMRGRRGSLGGTTTGCCCLYFTGSGHLAAFNAKTSSSHFSRCKGCMSVVE